MPFETLIVPAFLSLSLSSPSVFVALTLAVCLCLFIIRYPGMFGAQPSIKLAVGTDERESERGRANSKLFYQRRNPEMLRSIPKCQCRMFKAKESIIRPFQQCWLDIRYWILTDSTADNKKWTWRQSLARVAFEMQVSWNFAPSVCASMSMWLLKKYLDEGTTRAASRALERSSQSFVYKVRSCDTLFSCTITILSIKSPFSEHCPVVG